MQAHWTYTGCDKEDQEHISQVWRSRQAELDAKVSALGEEEEAQMWLEVEHSTSDESPPWRTRAALYAPRGVYTSEQTGDDPADLLDRMVGELSQQIDERLDKPSATKEERRGLDGITPFLESAYASRRSDSFFTFLTPVLRSLWRYVNREIRTRRRLGELPTEQLTARDVVDETMLQAWNEFSRRPKNLPLDLWLVQLVDHVIETGSQRIAEESLDDRQPEPSTDIRAEDTEWVEMPTDVETIELARLIPGEPGIESWDDLDVEAKQSHLDEIFEHLSRSQRQVLMLNAVEGFDTTTIADFQDRSQREVEEDLAAARLVLQRMARDEDLPEIEDRLERAALKRTRRAHRS